VIALPPVRVLVADPPWKFGDVLGKRGADAKYSTLDLAEIMAFPRPPVAPDAHLFLWRVSSMVEEAYQVVRAWGFAPKTEIVWRKKTKHGKRHFGMGRTVRAEHETVIVAVRGAPAVRDRSIRSTFEAPAGRHSEKPEEFFDLVEKLCAGPYAELFARRARPGWFCFGNELPSEACVPPTLTT
jgi:N6-adenosine-specific RNA methylase IME4